MLCLDFQYVVSFGLNFQLLKKKIHIHLGSWEVALLWDLGKSRVNSEGKSRDQLEFRTIKMLIEPK